jgi:tyramine---L-glutamate ligase
MRHFLFEFITGGGFVDQPLPESLISEGEIMIQTLIDELINAGYSDLSLFRDGRLALFDKDIKQYVVEESYEKKISESMHQVDVSWLIAPETGGCMLRLAELFSSRSKIFVGSTLDAIRIATSKISTYQALTDAGIKTVDTRFLSDSVPSSDSGWIIKPDDGVGSENCFIINDKEVLLRQAKTNEKFIVQPYIEGKSLSMSLLAFNGDVRLLGCNEQYIEIKKGQPKLIAVGVNEYLKLKNEMLSLAKKIVSTISGFAGYIGVDLIAIQNELYVLEINPRFTTAYAGISKSLGCNITEQILNTFLNETLPDIDLTNAIPTRVNI